MTPQLNVTIFLAFQLCFGVFGLRNYQHHVTKAKALAGANCKGLQVKQISAEKDSNED